MPTIDVTRTYLEMTQLGELHAAEPDGRLRVERVERCPISFFRYLYREVGHAHHWRDRLAWTDAEIAAYLATPGVSLWVAWAAGAPAGYFELRTASDGATEIVYFGLLPEFTGAGLGKQLLTIAVRTAWAQGAHRVWLHTCTLDHPAALPNYLARGFRAVREERYRTEIDGARA